MTRASEQNGRNRPIVRVELAKLFDKLPPHSLEAEAAVLGSMILGAETAVPEVAQLLDESDFWKQAHATIYRAMLDVWNENPKVDMVRLNERLRDRGELELVGGLDYLVELSDSVPSAIQAPYYARIVRGKARLRRLIEAAGETLHDAYNAADDAEAVEGRAMGRLLSLTADAGTGAVYEQGEIVEQVYAEIEKNVEQGGVNAGGIKTGILDLDTKLVGLEPGTVTVLAARPSIGKTACGMTIAAHMASNGHQPVIFNLEMNVKQIAYRRLSKATGISGWNLRRGEGIVDRMDEIQLAVGRLVAQKIRFAQTPGLTPMRLRTMATQLVRAGRCDCIFVDHLGLMKAPRAENRNIAIGEITREIKQMAEELEVPVVLLCQLNRTAAGSDDRPRMHQLRESGRIEEDADNVVLIHRPNYEEQRKPGHARYGEIEEAVLIVDKNRQGPTGDVNVLYDPQTMTFKNRRW